MAPPAGARATAKCRPRGIRTSSADTAARTQLRRQPRPPPPGPPAPPQPGRRSLLGHTPTAGPPRGWHPRLLECSSACARRFLHHGIRRPARPPRAAGSHGPAADSLAHGRPRPDARAPPAGTRARPVPGLAALPATRPRSPAEEGRLRDAPRGQGSARVRPSPSCLESSLGPPPAARPWPPGGPPRAPRPALRPQAPLPLEQRSSQGRCGSSNGTGPRRTGQWAAGRGEGLSHAAQLWRTGVWGAYLRPGFWRTWPSPQLWRDEDTDRARGAARPHHSRFQDKAAMAAPPATATARLFRRKGRWAGRSRAPRQGPHTGQSGRTEGPLSTCPVRTNHNWQRRGNRDWPNERRSGVWPIPGARR